MITIGDKEYRNLEEQVLKNMEDIAEIQQSVVDITTSDNTFTGVNNFEGNLYKLTESGAPQFAATNVMTAISFYDENDNQTGTVGVTSGGVKIKVNNNVIEVSDTGVGISAQGGVGIHNLDTPEDGFDAANKEYVDGVVADTVAGYLPLSGGTLTGDLNISNYKKLQFASGSYLQNESNTRTALYGNLKMANGNIILGTGLSINPPADTAVFNGIQFKGNVRLDDGLLYMNGKRIALVATPTAGTDAANKAYVDSVASAGGSSYTVTVTSNLANATISNCWKIGKMIALFGTFNDDLNLGANTVSVQAGDSINNGFIQCGDAVMSIASNGEFEEESSSTIQSGVNGRNFSATLFLQ